MLLRESTATAPPKGVIASIAQDLLSALSGKLG